MVLGSPLGSNEYVITQGQKRCREERKVLDMLPDLPDVQCAWLLLYFSAVSRANHLLRTVPSIQATSYAEARDKKPREEPLSLRNERAQLPCRLGGLGLRCATRISLAAYWASWADVLPTVRERFPELAAA